MCKNISVNDSDVKTINKNTVNYVPSKEDVDLYSIYRYTKECIPNFGKFVGLQRDLRENHIQELCEDMLNGNWVGDIRIKVDINTMCIISHNHTWEAWLRANTVPDFNLPLTVEYLEVPEDDNIRRDYLTADEKVSKWQLIDNVRSNMSKDESKPNSYNYLLNICKGHPFLANLDKKGNFNNPRFSYALACTFGDYKTYTRAIKHNCFKVHNQDVWNTTYDTLNEALAIRNALGLEKAKGCWIESFLTEWFYVKQEKKGKVDSFISVGGLQKILDSATKYAYEKGGLQALQEKKYWYSNLSDIVDRAMAA